LFAHIGGWWHGLIWLIAYVITDRAKFRRFITIVVLAVIIVAAWRLFGHGGWPILLHYFGTVSTAQPGSGPR
jgi:hypothetical protein